MALTGMGQSSNIGRRRAAAAEGGRENYAGRRAEIASAAAALFRERGYRRTSLAGIADAIGTERASLYYYFSTKEEILNEAVTSLVLANTAFIEEPRGAPVPPPDRIGLLIGFRSPSYADLH